VAQEYREGRRLRDGVLPGLIGAALSLVARIAQGAPGAVPGSPALRLATGLRRAIDEHFRDDWTVGRYVEHLGTTPHLLDRAAREVLGTSVKDAVLARRLLEAKRLLRFTIRPVEAVAYETGFRDSAYFSRFFAKRCGMPPAAWRRAPTAP
jgi:AraC family transcriptional activator of pobA